MLASILGIGKEAVGHASTMGNVPHGKVYNQGLTTSNLDVDSCQYAPKAVMQVDAETFGSQNSPLMNQDIVVKGGFEGVTFTSTDSNNLVLDNGVVVINPVIDSKTSNALLYQGYSVLDGDL